MVLTHQACESCYKKKIKCEVEGSHTTCVQCMRRNIRCKFITRKEKKENLKRYVTTSKDLFHLVADWQDAIHKSFGRARETDRDFAQSNGSAR